MPVKRFNRLISRDPEERFPEYAGKRLRYALIVIESENRKPVGVLRAQYSYLAFDPEGRLREDEREKVTRLSMELVEPLSGCVFRSIPSTDSGASRPPIPGQSVHRFRSKASTHSGRSRPLSMTI